MVVQPHPTPTTPRRENLPANFPTSDVPLLDGPVEAGRFVDDEGVDGWRISIRADALDVQGAARAAQRLLEKAGFTIEGTAMGANANVDAYRGPYMVSVDVFAHDPGEPTIVLYTVDRARG